MDNTGMRPDGLCDCGKHNGSPCEWSLRWVRINELASKVQGRLASKTCKLSISRAGLREVLDDLEKGR